jgi:hypothetical protein
MSGKRVLDFATVTPRRAYWSLFQQTKGGWFVRIVRRENTTGVWLKEPAADKREKDTQHKLFYDK